MPALVPQENLTELVTKAACPRCGYGLRGIVESWTDASPLTGVCSECGLAIDWKELLNPRRVVPRWCVEYGRRRSIPKTAIKTALIMFCRPRKFWRELKMIHEPRWGRFMALAILMLFSLHLVLASSAGINTHKNFKSLRDQSISTPYHPVVYGLYATVYPYSNYYFTYARWSRTNTPSEYARIPHPAIFWGEVRIQINNDKFINPFRWGLRLSSVIAQGMMLAVLCPLAFVVLPQSLRKAKVRWLHLIRIALYSSLILVPLMGLYIFHINNRMIFFTASPQNRVWFVQASLLYLLAGMIIWWSLAAKHYLKLPHAWGVGMSMVVLAYVVELFFASLINHVLF